MPKRTKPKLGWRRAGLAHGQSAWPAGAAREILIEAGVNLGDPAEQDRFDEVLADRANLYLIWRHDEHVAPRTAQVRAALESLAATQQLDRLALLVTKLDEETLKVIYRTAAEIGESPHPVRATTQVALPGGAVAIRGAAERGDADVAEHEAVAAAAIADPPV